MSIMSCKNCGQYIDTDYPEDGVWINDSQKPDYNNPTNILCDSCAENKFTDQELETYGY